ncbi:Hypothetical predicted protein [Octopus vulgaris]|uniref:Uncharacterized protein n=1 Tax=Octopus vulgaris TaxID=6645 RepID=A0AA36B921_OCTVU|nr:Hypothetical predicted protein [Octopus vulgaris]
MDKQISLQSTIENYSGDCCGDGRSDDVVVGEDGGKKKRSLVLEMRGEMVWVAILMAENECIRISSKAYLLNAGISVRNVKIKPSRA